LVFDVNARGDLVLRREPYAFSVLVEEVGVVRVTVLAKDEVPDTLFRECRHRELDERAVHESDAGFRHVVGEWSKAFPLAAHRDEAPELVDVHGSIGVISVFIVSSGRVQWGRLGSEGSL
jgi:hypothetical protein